MFSTATATANSCRSKTECLVVFIDRQTHGIVRHRSWARCCTCDVTCLLAAGSLALTLPETDNAILLGPTRHLFDWLFYLTAVPTKADTYGYISSNI